MAEASPSSFEGRQIGHFFLRQRLGRGAMGEVYLAHDEALDRLVAIKLLRDSYASDAEFVKRFQQEARAAARLSHPHIVQVYAVDVKADPPYMVMEYIEGHPLDAILGPDRKLPLDRALVICGQTAAALGCAHAANIIHRDIKPGNILIDSRGRVHVSDFGIAKVLTAHTQLTTDNRSLGSPAYMSPEQCLGQPVHAGSDLFSLGVTLFEMLTGRLPWFADTALVVMKKIAEEPLPPLSDFVQAPAEIELFLETLTAKDPAQRYASAAQVITDIQAFRARQPMPHLAKLNPTAGQIGPRPQRIATATAPPPPGAPQASAPLASNWYLVSGSAPAQAAPPATSKTLVDDLLDGTGSAFTRPRPPEKRSLPWGPIALVLALAALLAAAVPLLLREGDASPAPEEEVASPALVDEAPAPATLEADPIPAAVTENPVSQPGMPPPQWQPGMPLPPGMGPPGMHPPPPPPGAPWPPPHGQPPGRGQHRPPHPPRGPQR